MTFLHLFYKKQPAMFAELKISTTFATHLKNDAQMAESVDALVSNTSGVKSIPVRPRVWVLRKADNRLIISLICFLGAY